MLCKLNGFLSKKLLTLSTGFSTEKTVTNPNFALVINIINRLSTVFGVIFEKLEAVDKVVLTA